MGMGDKFRDKPAYEPYRTPVRCDVSGYMFTTTNTRRCRDGGIIARYGHGGVCHVSVWVCRRCRHAVKHEFHGGLSCELERQL